MSGFYRGRAEGNTFAEQVVLGWGKLVIRKADHRSVVGRTEGRFLRGRGGCYCTQGKRSLKIGKKGEVQQLMMNI